MRIGKNLDTKGYGKFKKLIILFFNYEIKIKFIIFTHAGIATPINSEWTTELNLKILSLKESSELAKLELKWWFEVILIKFNVY